VKLLVFLLLFISFNSKATYVGLSSQIPTVLGGGSGGSTAGVVSQGGLDGSAGDWKFNLTKIAGAVPSATNAIPVQLTDGTGFYSASSKSVATLLPPTLIEGSTNPLSSDLAGGLRVSLSTTSKFQLWDGTTDAVIKPASTSAVDTDPSIVVGLSPNSPAKIFDGTNTLSIKPASTSALVSDTSAVIAISPNSNKVVLSDNVTDLPVIPASTSAVDTDPSIVVQVSPNSPTQKLGQYNAVAPVLLDGETSPLQVDGVGNLKVISTSGGVAAATNDASGGITAGTVAQILLPANTTLKRILVQNSIYATEPLYINFGTTWAGVGSAIEIPPGQKFDTLGTVAPNDQIWIYANTTAHAFVAKWW